VEYVFIFKYLSIAFVFLAVYTLAGQLQSREQKARFSLWQRLKTMMIPDTGFLPAEVLKKWNTRKLQRVGIIAGIAGGLFGFVISGVAWNDPRAYCLVLVLAGAGFLMPRFILAFMRRQRLQALEIQLPDALELISNSLRAGLSVVQALEVVAREAALPIAEEFGEVVRDCRLGLAPEDAMEKMLKRWPHKDLELFVVAANVSLRTGGNLAEVAGRIIATLRERFRLQGRIASLTAQGKMSGWVVGLLPVVLLIGLSLLDPELMAGFFQHPLGLIMLAGGLLMELVGAFFIRRIVNIET